LDLINGAAIEDTH